MTEHDANWYRNQMNAAGADLTAENRAYFDDLLVYALTKRLWVRELPLVRELYGMQRDLLDAQRDGMTAHDFFGDNPRAMADTLVRQYGRFSWHEVWNIVGVVVGINFIIAIVSDPSTGPMRVSWLALLVSTLIESGGIFAVFTLINRSIFARSDHGNRTRIQWGVGILTGILVLALVLTWVLVPQLPARFNLVVPQPWDLLLMGSTVAAGLWAFLRLRDRMFYPLAGLLLIWGGGQMFFRLEADGFLNLGQTGRYVYAGVLVVALIGFYIVTWRQAKKA